MPEHRAGPRGSLSHGSFLSGTRATVTEMDNTPRPCPSSDLISALSPTRQLNLFNGVRSPHSSLHSYSERFA